MPKALKRKQNKSLENCRQQFYRNDNESDTDNEPVEEKNSQNCPTTFLDHNYFLDRITLT